MWRLCGSWVATKTSASVHLHDVPTHNWDSRGLRQSNGLGFQSGVSAQMVAQHKCASGFCWPTSNVQHTHDRLFFFVSVANAARALWVQDFSTLTAGAALRVSSDMPSRTRSRTMSRQGGNKNKGDKKAEPKPRVTPIVVHLALIDMNPICLQAVRSELFLCHQNIWKNLTRFFDEETMCASLVTVNKICLDYLAAKSLSNIMNCDNNCVKPSEGEAAAGTTKLCLYFQRFTSGYMQYVKSMGVPRHRMLNELILMGN